MLALPAADWTSGQRARARRHGAATPRRPVDGRQSFARRRSERTPLLLLLLLLLLLHLLLRAPSKKEPFQRRSSKEEPDTPTTSKKWPKRWNILLSLSLSFSFYFKITTALGVEKKFIDFSGGEGSSLWPPGGDTAESFVCLADAADAADAQSLEHLWHLCQRH